MPTKTEKYQSVPGSRTRRTASNEIINLSIPNNQNQRRQLSTVVSSVSDRRSITGTWEGEAWRTSSVPTRARQVTDRAKVLRALPLNEKSIASSPPPSNFRGFDSPPSQASLMAGAGHRLRARAIL